MEKGEDVPDEAMDIGRLANATGVQCLYDGDEGSPPGGVEYILGRPPPTIRAARMGGAEADEGSGAAVDVRDH